VAGNANKLTGVILAAGRGTRMGVLSTKLPKPVLPVLNRPIVYHQMQLMAECGVQRVIIVVGHLGFEVARQIERMPGLGLEIDYVPQDRALGIAHSVGALEPHIDSPFLLFLGDIYLQGPKLDRMLTAAAQPGADAVIGSIREPDPSRITRNFCIEADKKNRVSRVIEKPRHPASDVKGIGVYWFAPSVFDAVRRTPRTAMRDEYEITDSIQIMIDDGRAVYACNCAEEDVNITNPQDLLAINLHALAARGEASLVHDSANVAKDAKLDQTIVGAGATVGAGAQLSRVVVFAGAQVEAGANLTDAVVTEQGAHPV
jgi:dTDP-glucose pyrophosphorylase